VLADLWLCDLRLERDEHRVQRGVWETKITLNVVPSDPDLYPEKVYCLLLCSISYGPQFILILRAGDRSGEYQRYSIGRILDQFSIPTITQQVTDSIILKGIMQILLTPQGISKLSCSAASSDQSYPYPHNQCPVAVALQVK
jgi:hypothetical protein